MRLSDFDYELPPELIARYPLTERSASRLISVDRHSGEIKHRHFRDLISLLSENDLLVFNNSKVIPARLFGQKPSGGRVEILVERIIDDQHVLVHMRASKKPARGSYLLFAENVQFEVIERQQDLFLLRCLDERPVLAVIEALGEIPLPPYLERAPEAQDKDRYQTVYALHQGSVAAPTAGLHFDLATLKQLREKNIALGFVTLHVGAGTFAPVRVEDITQHTMHSEICEVTHELCEQIRLTKAKGGRVIAIGTTSARSLETAAQSGNLIPYEGETNIFIYPGYQFKCVDALLTNLHLPGSTLLMLVSAFGGYENMIRAYCEAIMEKYRFFSYGDAMWIF